MSFNPWYFADVHYKSLVFNYFNSKFDLGIITNMVSTSDIISYKTNTPRQANRPYFQFLMWTVRIFIWIFSLFIFNLYRKNKRINIKDMVRLLSSVWRFLENIEGSSRLLKLRSDLKEYNQKFQNIEMKQIKIPMKRSENKKKTEQM